MSASVLALVLPLLAPSIAAEVAVPEEADIFDAFPIAIDDATVPENGRLLVSGATRFLVTHADTRIEDLVATEPSFFMHTRTFRTLSPTLVEGDTITVERVCEGCGEGAYTWTVGPVDDDAPVFTDGPTNTNGGIVGLYDNDPEAFNNNRFGFSVSGWLAPLQTPEMVIIHITGEGVDEHQIAFDDEEGPWVTFQVPGPLEREACFEATAIDAAGNESAPYDFCVDLVDDRRNFLGCAQTGSSSSVLAVLGAMLLRRRRR
jgi:hypothetical protein